jgi:hypothetical protein
MDGVTYNLFIFINMLKRWMESLTVYSYTLYHDVELDIFTYFLLTYINMLER